MGTSGSGKSTYLRGLLRQEKPYRVVAWDPDEDYPLQRVHSVGQYARALKGATASGKRYRLAVTVTPTVANFERFCKALWAVADAERPITVIVEELADVSAHAGKATPAWGELIRKGRKYGVTLWVVTQSPTEISKTIYRNVGCLWAGILRSETDRRRVAQYLDVDVSRLQGLAPLEYACQWMGHPVEWGKVRLPRRRKETA